jgi:DHA3 family tetracycline resistance protein-like MFS transporter
MLFRKKLNAELAYYVMSGGISLFNATMFVYLTVFYYKMVGLDPLQLVLVGTVLEGALFLLEVPTGVVADTYSRRLSVVLGILALGVAFFVTGLARSFPVVLLAQVIAALGYAFTSGATDAWLADEVGEEKVGAVYIRSGQINRLLWIIGILVSGALASVRLDVPILVGGVLYFLLGLFLAAKMPETNFHPFQHENEARGLPAMLATFREGTRILRLQPFLITLVLINFFVGAASEGFDRLGDAYLLDNFTFPPLVLPVLGRFDSLVWFSILSLLGSLLSLLVVERLRKRMEKLAVDQGQTARVLTLLNLAFSAAGIGFALAGSFPLAVGCMLLRGLVGSLIWPLFNAYQVQSIPSHVRATLLSMASQGNAIGQVLGGPLVGWIGNRSLRAALALAGLLVLPNSFLYRKQPGSTPGVESHRPQGEAAPVEGTLAEADAD